MKSFRQFGFFTVIYMYFHNVLKLTFSLLYFLLCYIQFNEKYTYIIKNQLFTSLNISLPKFLYQSIWGENAPQRLAGKELGHWVCFHCLLHFGHFAAVSNVFQTQPQLHCQCLPPSGLQLHLGQAISIFIILRI